MNTHFHLPLMLALAASFALPHPAHAQTVVAAQEVTDWKAVYGRVETKDTLSARARLGGTLTELTVSEGDVVTAGQVMGRIMDEKLAFQLAAVDAQLSALTSQLTNAQAELARGEDLLQRGVTTKQRVDALRTAVDVVSGQIDAQRSQRQVIEQQSSEGEVLAPIAGLVLDVPVAKGSVLMAGEVVAMVGGGGVFLRVSVPERHAATLVEGAEISIENGAALQMGRLAKVYPQISNGRVTADVEVPDLATGFVDARVLVRLPIGTRRAITVPLSAISTRAGLDFVTVMAGEDRMERAVVPGRHETRDGVVMVEIVSGLTGGEVLVDSEAQAGGVVK